MPRPAANSESLQPGLAQCAGCRLEADERFTVAEHWAWWVNGEGELVPYCPSCSQRSFGHRTTMTADLLPSARSALRHVSGDVGKARERPLRLLDVPSEVETNGARS